MAKMSALRYLIPFGCVRAFQVASQLRDLGLPASRAWRLALDPGIQGSLKTTNLNLLPSGSLKDGSVVIDVGANCGDWAYQVMRFCSPTTLICVEPHPDLADALRRRFTGQQAVSVLETALGRETGSTDLYVAANSQLHSLRRPAQGMVDFFPAHFKVESVTRVSVHRLDEITTDLRSIALLKIDAQGSEREVLAGAIRTLQKTRFVLLEVNFVPHYEGEADFFELNALMQTHGFRLSNYSDPKGGKEQALFADMLYSRVAE